MPSTRFLLIVRFVLVAALCMGFADTALAKKKNKKKKRGKKATPEWVVKLSEIELPEYDKDTEAVYLRDESRISISENGVLTRTIRVAIKALSIESRNLGNAYASYSSDTDRVRNFEAWMLTPDGDVKHYGEDEIIDRSSLDSNSVATTSRYQLIRARGDWRKGNVFAYEYTIEDDSIFRTEDWYFQSRHPARESSISFDVPEGWIIEPVFINMPGFEPLTSAHGKTWAKQNIPALDIEDWAPNFKAQAMFAAFKCIPPVGTELYDRYRIIREWKDLSIHYTPQYLARSIVTPELTQRVQNLVSENPSKSEQITALAKLAQSVNYASVALDLGSGEGMVPRPAAEVLSSNYGDCKDKSNMLTTLLSQVDVKAYPVIVNIDNRGKIYEEFPTGLQFNHCIIGIEVDDTVESHSIIEHDSLGRLLLFDPTDQRTSFGDLPKSLQGSKGVVLAGEQGGLVSLPSAGPMDDYLKRSVQVEIFPSGELVGKFSEEATGQASRRLRYYYQSAKNLVEYSDSIKSWISNTVPAPRTNEATVEDNFDGNSFSLKMDFGSSGYGKSMGGALVVFKPIVLGRWQESPFDKDEERTQPVIVVASHIEEDSEIFIPPGFKFSEAPQSISIESEVGTYELSFSVEEDRLKVYRKQQINNIELPAAEFEKASSFFEGIVKAEQTSLVLERI